MIPLTMNVAAAASAAAGTGSQNRNRADVCRTRRESALTAVATLRNAPPDSAYSRRGAGGQYPERNRGSAQPLMIDVP
ncbi:hypothetical protein GCM10009534_72570 [Kribbella sandramycini]